jgi:hypothetical protein
MPEAHRHEPTDLYELLEVSPHASQDVIQAAYRVLVRTYHPDRNPSFDAAQHIRELNAAYGVLSDPESRACYDLECARTHRFERLSQPLRRPTPPQGLPARPVRATKRAGDERLPLLNGQAVVGLILVATLATVLIVLIWFALEGMDAATRETGPYVVRPAAEPDVSVNQFSTP